MLNALTDHQRQALDRYESLRRSHPQLFRQRLLRSLILDRARLETFAVAGGVVLGVAAETPHFVFVIDLVEAVGGGAPFAYSRLVNVGQMNGGVNVAILGVIDDSALGTVGDLLVVEQERHATGQVETAIPRGFGEAGQDGRTAALRELEEETGYSGKEVTLLGEAVIDSGAGDARVSFYRVRVTARTASRPEETEAIRAVRQMAPAALWKAVRSGEVSDSFTLQALALAGYCSG